MVMKKKIFSIVLSLCMVVAMMPMASGFAWTEETTSGEGSGSTTGSTIVGTYAYVKSKNQNSAALDDIVSTVATKYGVTDKESMAIHELVKNETQHIAYGVVVAYEKDKGRACFIGDALDRSTGYFLSTQAETGTVTMKAGEVASDMAKKLSISLDQTGNLDFGSKDKGYTVDTSEAKAVTISNVGNAATVSKSGKITALTAGNCEIYVYGINGSREVVEVTVK